TTTSVLRTRCERGPVVPRVDSLSASVRSDAGVWSPGITPTKTPHTSATTAVNTATRRSKPGATKLGNVTGVLARSSVMRARARNPQVCPVRDPSRSRRHHADDRVRLAVDGHDAAHDVWVAAEAPLPEPVAHHDDQLGPRNLVFPRLEHAAC